MISQTVKPLIIVLIIAVLIFGFAKPVALRFTSDADFVRRRNVWFALTITAFISPNFWLFVLVASPLLIWAGRKDSNPIGFYLLLLHVIPPIPVVMPVIGIHALFDMDNYRLLCFCVLMPAAQRIRKSKSPELSVSIGTMDILVLAWGLMIVVQYVPPDMPGQVLISDSLTNAVRRAFMYFIDVYVLYFVVSRACSNRRAILDAQAAFCLSCAIMSGIAFFEFLHKWLLYSSMAVRWGDVASGFYLFRGDSLRALASSSNALTLGYLLAIAFGLWLYLKSSVQSPRMRLAIPTLYWMGLFATYSRGPWIGAVVIYFAFAALGPRGLSRVFRASCVAGVVAGALILSPFGDKIAKVLPFMGGSLDSGSIDYRQQLANRSWELFKESPLWGDQLAYLKMGDLRQGQGIIDLVNTYAEVAVFHGLIGLSLFLSVIIVGLIKTYRLARKVLWLDQDLALLGISLVASIVGTLIMISSCSFLTGYEKIFYVLAGFSSAYISIHNQAGAVAQVNLASGR